MTHVQVSVDINLIVENVKKKFDFATGDLIFLNIWWNLAGEGARKKIKWHIYILILILPHTHKKTFKQIKGTPLVAQWLESICQCKRYGFDPWSQKIPHAADQLSPCTTTAKLLLQSPGTAAIEPMFCDEKSHCNQTPKHHS